MVLSRVLGAIGRVMIAAGVILLLFVAYQLWGTGVRTDQAQNRLGAQFDQQVAQATAGAATPTTAADGTTAPLSLAELAKDPQVQAYAKDKRYYAGEPIGKITIPKIGADFWMVQGVDLPLLSEGPGHFPGTPMPGQPGNAALAGHRTTFKAPFNRVDELEPGDTVTVETLQGRFTYEVLPQKPQYAGGPALGHYIIDPSQTEILDDKGDNRLTLMACHPKYSAAERIVVEAKLVSNPAEATPKGDADPGSSATALANLGSDEATADLISGGDANARGPAILWGLAAAAVVLAAWLLGRWKRSLRWPAYLVAVVPFLVLLFFCFENVTKLLPSAY
ncbi:MAG: class E sortase [Acidimicrobiales bacterium]